MKENLNLQQLTLIIPTFNRHAYLARLLNYYGSKNTSLQFLILDSSEERIKKLNEQACKALRAYYMSFSTSTPVAAKLLAGLKEVKTPFCAFCADDDLVLLNGLAQALLFLTSNPDYVCADGIYLNFNQIGFDVHLKIEYATKGMNAEDPGARVFKLYQKYESLFYGVFQTQNALNIFTGVNENKSLHYQELFQATSTLLLGKSHRLPVFYAARQNCMPADLQRDKWQTYYWFADNPGEFIEHYLIYRESLWNFYQQHDKKNVYNKNIFYKVMDIAHAMYFGIGCPSEYFHSVLQPNWPSQIFQEVTFFQDNICNELKSSHRLWWEYHINKICLLIPKKFASLYSIHHIRSLNTDIQKKLKMPWQCKLEPEIRWLANVDSFRQAYYELCLYMLFT